jgi:hypothetical protein
MTDVQLSQAGSPVSESRGRWPQHRSAVQPEHPSRLANRRQLGGTPPLSGRREEPARAVLSLDGLRQLRRELCQLSVRAADRPHAPPFAHPVEFGNGFVKALPQSSGSTTPRARLKFVRRFSATSSRWPLVTVFVGRLARRGPLRCRRCEFRNPSAEPRVGRGKHVVSQRAPPHLTRRLERLLRVHPYAPSRPSVGSPAGCDSRGRRIRGSGG